MEPSGSSSRFSGYFKPLTRNQGVSKAVSRVINCMKFLSYFTVIIPLIVVCAKGARSLKGRAVPLEGKTSSSHVASSTLRSSSGTSQSAVPELQQQPSLSGTSKSAVPEPQQQPSLSGTSQSVPLASTSESDPFKILSEGEQHLENLNQALMAKYPQLISPKKSTVEPGETSIRIEISLGEKKLQGELVQIQYGTNKTRDFSKPHHIIIKLDDGTTRVIGHREVKGANLL